jgi:hypothetical protein
VRRERRYELFSEPGQNVHHSTRKIGYRQHFAEDDRRIRVRLRREADDSVPRKNYRRDLAQQSEQRKFVVGNHTDDTHRLGNGEIEERASDRIGVAEHLLVLVGPACVIDQPVDAGRDLFRRRGLGARS